MRISDLDSLCLESIKEMKNDPNKYFEYKRTHISSEKPQNYTTDVKVHYDSGFIMSLHHLYSTPNYHTHSYIEVMYVISGTFSNDVEGEHHVMNAGDICIIPPGIYHAVDHIADNVEECILLNISVPVDNGKDILSGLLHGCPLSDFLKHILDGTKHEKYAILHTEKKCDPVDSMMKSLHLGYIERFLKSKADIPEIKPFNALYYRSKYDGDTHTLGLALCSALSEACTGGEYDLYISPSLVKSAVPVTKILSYIRDNFTSVSLENIAETFNYSFAYTSRLIKAFTGVTFVKLVAVHRIEKACELLRTGDLSVKAIAKDVGYDSVEHFHRVFKSEKGMSPAEYRKLKKKA